MTSLFLLLIVLSASFLLKGAAFDAAVWLVLAVAAWEFFGIFGKQLNFKQRLASVLILTTIVINLGLYCDLAWLILLFGGCWWVLAVYLIWRYVRSDKFVVGMYFVVFIGIMSFVPAWLSISVVRQQFGIEYLYCLLGMVWAADIGGYLGGMFFGKRILLAKVSPKKTIEGFYGSVAAVLLVATIEFWLLTVNEFGVGYLPWLGLALATGLASVIGDMFESMLKRLAGVKDSGNLLPGHGGLYDRVDSLLAAAPIFAVGIVLI